MRSRSRSCTCLGLGLVLVLVGARAPDPSAGQVAVIADRGFPVADLTFGQVAALATGGAAEIAGTPVTILMPPQGDPARDIVLRRLYRMSEGEFQQFWISRILRTRGAEAPKAVTPQQAGRLVQRIPGAIAFVDAGSLPPGVKVLTIDGRRPGQSGYAFAD